MELIIENLRSFSGKHTIPIKPLTLLTGENSSGKSTLLASLAVVSDSSTFPLRPNFNEPPYALGNYDSIATFKGGRSKHVEFFSLGYKPTGKADEEHVARYVSNRGLIEVSSVVEQGHDFSLEFRFLSKGGTRIVEVRVIRDGNSDAAPIISRELKSLDKDFLYILFSAIFSHIREAGNGSDGQGKSVNYFTSLFDPDLQSRALSIAPIRTKPRRTYDEITDEFSPQGEHIPFVLSGVLDNTATREIMERFGKESGLYTKLAVKRFGKQFSDPTRVIVAGSGPDANLIDVGYGVSQVLPIVVQSILTTPQTLLLVQQPEVHLHPRAQAALGSLFANLVARGDKQFVVETHSDYIIDRVRMEVARGTIPAEDVGILYLEKSGFETRVHALELSETGDIINAPPSYRDFFMEEELNLLYRAGR